MNIIFYENGQEVGGIVRAWHSDEGRASFGTVGVVRHMERLTAAEMAYGLTHGFEAHVKRDADYIRTLDEALEVEVGGTMVGHIPGNRLVLWPEDMGEAARKVFRADKLAPEDCEKRHMNGNKTWVEDLETAVRMLYGEEARK